MCRRRDAYNSVSSRLTVCPESMAWATKARLEQTRDIEAADKAVGCTVVRALQTLSPGTTPAPPRRRPDQPVPGRARTFLFRMLRGMG
ncbi:hypothetical protein FHS40_008823 [Streptomyces spectabilis]|uniref:Uncharacterized protein n=1 Tax=Streptomyces spectabilis TaxID=68270 RepID=A0A7W8EZR6_STRST|nr:hypothetical protein [Streptomyces spectabilis]